jgi:dipeptidyl aminopeptidase/acylaminoacyl peptidase
MRAGRYTPSLRTLAALSALLAAACGPASADRAPAPLPDQPASTASTGTRIDPDAPPGLGAPGTMSDTVVRGTVLLADRQPAAHADVYVGVAEGLPGEGDTCDRPGGLLALTRTAPDGHGRWLTRLPRAEPGLGEPACVFVVAEVRDTTGPTRDVVSAAGWTGAPIGGEPIHLVLERVRRDEEPLARRPDGAWIAVAERIPGWAGFVLEAGGCRAVVGLTDLRQQAAARAYVDSVLAGRGRRPSCGPSAGVRFRQVEYDWAQLQRWYERAGILGAFQGMQMSDVDEGRNRLVFTYTDPAGARAARRALAVLRVPAAAFVIEAPEQALVMPSDTFGPDTPRLGRRLATRGWPGAPAWSADGREILFVTVEGGGPSPRQTIRAAGVETRAERELGAVRGMNTGGGHLRMAADGATYAAIALPGAVQYAIWRIPPGGGAPEQVADGLAWPWFTMDAAGRRFAFSAAVPGADPPRETLVVLDRETGTRDTVRGGMPGPAGQLEMSPDGRALAYAATASGQPGESGVWLYDLRTRQARQLWSAPGMTEAAPALRWQDGRPRLLLVRRAGPDHAELSELDPATGRRTRLALAPTTPGEHAATLARWSADGRRVAYWSPIAIGPQSCGNGFCISRNVVHWRLFVWETGQAQPRVLADVASDEGAAWLEFSPDGRRIAYLLNGSVYTHDLP